MLYRIILFILGNTAIIISAFACGDAWAVLTFQPVVGNWYSMAMVCIGVIFGNVMIITGVRMNTKKTIVSDPALDAAVQWDGDKYTKV